MSYYFLAESKLENLVTQQVVRSRMRYELSQDINNLFIDLKKTRSVQNSNQQNLLQKLTTAKYLSNRYLDKGQYFIEHLESTMSLQSNLSGIKYKLWVDRKSIHVDLDLEQRSKILDLIYHLFENWKNQTPLEIELTTVSENFALSVYNVDERLSQELYDSEFENLTIENTHLRCIFKK